MQAFATACPDFVPFVERGITAGRQILGVAEGYLAPLQEQGVDTLVLGCTHYPLLTGIIQLAMGDNVSLVTSSEETTKDVMRILTETDMLAPQRISRSTLLNPPEIRRLLPALPGAFSAPRLHKEVEFLPVCTLNTHAG